MHNAERIAPTGRLRVAINLGNPVLARRGAAGPEGVSVDLAQAIAARLGVPGDLIAVDAAPKSVALVEAGEADIGFFAIDPDRAGAVTFTDPIVIIEGRFVVPEASPLTAPDQVDRDGVRVAVGHGSAYALHLARSLGAAKLVEAPTSREAVPLMLRDGLEAAAGISGQMAEDVARYPGLRLLPGAFMTIRQAVALPAARGAEAAAWLRDAVAALRDSGAVAEAMARHGAGGARPAVAGD